MSIPHIYERVCNWNAARYARENNKELAVKLLREEYREYLDAKTEVDQLDALCDIVYVAMGVLWKAGVPDTVQDNASARAAEITQALIEYGEVNPAYFIGTYLDVYEHLDNYPTAQAMHNIICAAFTQMTGMFLTLDQCVAAMTIVCDSNDSKPAVKTASNIKANIDKGDSFIPPEPRLKELLASRGIH